MEHDPLLHITGRMHELPKNQQRVAEYFLNHWERALYETSITIAEKVGVGQSTVVRTVVNLGYGGFPEFQSSLRSLLDDRFSTVGRIHEVSGMQRGHSLKERIAQVFDQNRANLDAALRDLAVEKVALTSEMIWKAKRVYVLGLRTGGALASYFGMHLAMIRPGVTILSSDLLLMETLRTATKRDVVFAFSFIRYLRKTIEAASYAKERGCRIVGMTESLSGPLAGIAEILFLAPVTSMYFGNSYVAPFAVIDVLLSAIGYDHKKEVLQALREMEDGCAKLKIFFSRLDLMGSNNPFMQKMLADAQPAVNTRNPPAAGEAGLGSPGISSSGD